MTVIVCHRLNIYPGNERSSRVTVTHVTRTLICTQQARLRHMKIPGGSMGSIRWLDLGKACRNRYEHACSCFRSAAPTQARIDFFKGTCTCRRGVRSFATLVLHESGSGLCPGRFVIRAISIQSHSWLACFRGAACLPAVELTGKYKLSCCSV